MSNIDYNTASMLKEHGYPQPELVPGQFWWGLRQPRRTGKDNEPTLVLCVIVQRQPDINFAHTRNVFEPLDGGEWILSGLEAYCPTAAELIREIENITLKDVSIKSITPDYWLCSACFSDCKHASLETALAMCWIEIKSK